jgi:hypothetical protein
MSMNPVRNADDRAVDATLRFGNLANAKFVECPAWSVHGSYTSTVA